MMFPDYEAATEVWADEGSIEEIVDAALGDTVLYAIKPGYVVNSRYLKRVWPKEDNGELECLTT